MALSKPENFQGADLLGGGMGGRGVSAPGKVVVSSPLLHSQSLPPDRFSWVVYTRWGWERPSGLQWRMGSPMVTRRRTRSGLTAIKERMEERYCWSPGGDKCGEVWGK